MEWGLAKGLAVDLQYDKRIADARYQDMQMKRAQAQNLAELQAFEDDLDYNNAANSFDHDLIKNEANKTINEIGQVIRENPDWRVNPNVRRIINEKKKYLKTNQHVIRGMASDKAYGDYLNDMKEVAKNPAMYDTDAYSKIQQEWDNYRRFGNQLGADAAKSEGYQPFIYRKPADFDRDLEKKWIGLGNNVKDKDLVMLGNGGYREAVKEDKLKELARGEYYKNKRQVDVMYSPKSEEEAINTVADIIRQGVQTQFKAPEVNFGLQTEMARQRFQREMAQHVSNGIDPYVQSLKNKRENYIEPEALSATLGTTPEARIYNKDGQFKGTTKGRKFIPNGEFVQANEVQRVAPYRKKDGTVSEYAPSRDKTFGVAKGYVEMSEDEVNDAGYFDDPSMQDNITHTTKMIGNKKIDVYLVPAQVHFDVNDEGKRLRFNSYVGSTTKQLQGLEPMQNEQQPKQVVQNGITYTYNPQTGQYE